MQAEVIGIASGAAALLQQAINLFNRVRSARDRQADLPSVLRGHMAAIEATKSIVEFVKKEGSLATPNIAANLVRIRETAQALTNHLAGMHAKFNTGRFKSFAHQFLSGSEDQRRLENITDKLTSHKMDLSVNIGLVNVGLVRGFNDTMAINTGAIEELNERIKALLGESYGLRLAEMIKDRPKKVLADGTVMLAYQDVVKMAGMTKNPPSYDTEVPGSASKKVRYI